MHLQPSTSNSPTSDMHLRNSQTRLEELLQPCRIGTHSVEVNKTIKSYLRDKCIICYELFCEHKPISEFDCGHIIHTECLIKMLQANNGRSNCSYCGHSNPSLKHNAITISGWIHSKVKTCINDNCFFNTDILNKNIIFGSDNPDCPFPLSCFDSVDQTSIGFLHRYGRILLIVINESMKLLNFRFKNYHLYGITGDEKKHLEAKFHADNDLTSISKRIDNQLCEVKELVEFTGSAESSDMTCKEKLKKITDNLEQTLKAADVIKTSLMELRSLIEQHSGFDEKNQRKDIAKTGLKYISKNLQKEIIPGLSSMTEKEIDFLLHFESRFGEMTITLSSDKLNNSKKSIYESFEGVKNIIKYAPFEARVAYLHPAIFDRESSLHFARPFDYIEDKIAVVSRTDTRRIIYIPLSKIINDTLDDFNYIMLKTALTDHSLDYSKLTARL